MSHDANFSLLISLDYKMIKLGHDYPSIYSLATKLQPRFQETIIRWPLNLRSPHTLFGKLSARNILKVQGAHVLKRIFFLQGKTAVGTPSKALIGCQQATIGLILLIKDFAARV
jgi:hypothetical protein